MLDYMHQVKQEKSGGQEQVSTSPYPTTFPEALAFPNYEAAMNQYTSVSPSQGWQTLHRILCSVEKKVYNPITILRLSYNSVLPRAIPGVGGSVCGFGARAVWAVWQLWLCGTQSWRPSVQVGGSYFNVERKSITMTQSTEYRADTELESGHNMGGFMSIQVGASQSYLAQPHITHHLYFNPPSHH